MVGVVLELGVTWSKGHRSSVGGGYRVVVHVVVGVLESPRNLPRRRATTAVAVGGEQVD